MAAKAANLTGLVPMIQVADVERSAAFYRLLGFEIGNRVPKEDPPQWVWLYARDVEDWKHGPNIMLVRGKSSTAADSKVLFYIYVSDLVELRNQLLTKGIDVSEISYPEYLPRGEFSTQDPDGYCLMVAQSGPDTP